MNKVGIVTLHNFNYGSVLQCYATQTILNSLGYDAQVIEENNSCNRWIGLMQRMAGIAKVAMRSPKDVISIWKILKSSTAKSLRLTNESKESIQHFVKENLKIHHATKEELLKESHSDEWAFYLSGSDQVWGGSAIEGDNTRFLRFAPMSKRVAWAASFGSGDVARYNEQSYSRYIAQYAKISVREASGASLTQRYAKRHSEVLCDPVFLLTADEWRERVISKAVPLEKYLLAFFIDEPNAAALSYIEKVCEEGSLIPVSFGYRYSSLERLTNYRHFDGDPFVFLAFIDKAEHVATDSFHALAFSSILHTHCEIFDRQYQHNQNQNTRIVDFKAAIDNCGGIDNYVIKKREQALAFLRSIHTKQSYVAACKDESLIDKSASGGIFAMIARGVLHECGIVYGAAMCIDNGQLSVKHIAVEKDKELWRVQGSKYVESSTKGIYDHVLEQLNTGRKVLFSGTSCQVAALKAFVKKDYQNLITVDLVCHGVPKADFLDDYIHYLENKYQKRIIYLSFRNRHLRPYYQLGITFNDGEHQNIPLRDSSYYRIFMSRCGYRKSCYVCRYANVDKPADITLADYALTPQERVAYGFERTGLLSSIIVHTAKGEEVLANHKDECILQAISLERMMESHQQLQHPSIPENKRWWNLYQQGGFESVEKSMMRRNRLMSIPSRVRMRLKNW